MGQKKISNLHIVTDIKVQTNKNAAPFGWLAYRISLAG